MNHPSTSANARPRSEPKRRLPQQERAQQKVKAFFKATAQILEVQGEAGLSTNKVAEHTGLSIGTLYQYFPNKEQLVWAMATREQALVMARLEGYLSRLEADPLVAHQQSLALLRGGINILVEGFARGRATSLGARLGRTLIRLAWTWENIEDTIAVASQVTDRLHRFFRNIRHPSLPPPTSAQMFVVVRGVMGVLRYESLAQSPLLDSDDLVDQLTQLAWSMFVERPEPTVRATPGSGMQNGPILPQALARALLHGAEEATKWELEDKVGLRRKPAQKRAEETIGTIFKALMQVLDAEGDDGLTTNKVAKRSGFSIGTLYQYFPDKKKLVWAASVYGFKALYGKMDAYLSAIEAAVPSDRPEDHREFIRYTVHLYAWGLSVAKGPFAGQVFSQPLARLGWRWENPHDTYYLAEQVAARVKLCCDNIRHPAYPEVIDPQKLRTMNLALLGVLRHVTLERSPLLGSTALIDAMVLMATVMQTGKA